ncbi:MAG: multidrug ABC transporter permease [Fervidicoccus fontis]|uniref:Multidrug ABC transporter permease n=2 Tax=Fervidicoccus fontis TaxID=683846 RepID=A0A7C2ZPL5_9CREN|nr:MAG: multidrug ABC transporter permease [Fervidicoccus fontis]HEW63753.1 multidrug ABC transporter permease [Fervidicoccus fontis]
MDKMKQEKLISIFAMAEMELRRIRHDPVEIFTRAIQPILWVAVFGSVMAKVRAFPSTGDYVTFISPGVILQSSTFISLSYGIMLVFERESGVLKRLLSSPMPRSYIVIGRSLAGALRSSTQYIIVLVAAALVGAKLTTDPLDLILGYFILTFASMGFTAISIVIASTLKTRERFMGIVGAITMPLFFASNALYPIQVMPRPIQVISFVNPLTYTVSALRTLLVQSSLYIGSDMLIITIFVLVSMFIAIKLLPRIIE